MHPVIAKIGPLYIKAYGLMLALSFILGIYLACRRAKRVGEDCQQVMDLSVWILVAAIAGSRFYYVITHWSEFGKDLLAIISPVRNGEVVGIGGLSMQGGVILAVITALWYLRRKKLPVWKFTDILAPSFMLGMAITRIGCFFNGCCWGKPTDSVFGVVFSPESAAGWLFRDVPLHPTQLYSSAAGILLLTLILVLERGFKRYDGFTFWLTMGLYSLWRFIIDFARYYESQMKVFSIGSVVIINNQLISLAGVALSAGFMVWLHKRAGRRRDS